MSRKNNHLVIENLDITDIAAEGKSIGKYGGQVVFVSQAIPGDTVDVNVYRKRKNYLEGFVIKYHKYSEKRIDPFCRHFGVCGGCKWQHLPYTEQLSYKQKQVADSLERIGKVRYPALNPILASENQQYYRNKLEYTFSENRWLTDEEVTGNQEILQRKALGFHIPGRFDRVLDIRECHLQADPSNEIREKIRTYALTNNLPFFDQVKLTGFLRNLIIRNTLEGELMIILTFFEEVQDDIQKLLAYIWQEIPGITSLMYAINPKANDTIIDLSIYLYKGRDYITEKFEDLTFRLGPKSFFQTNSLQALNLYRVVREFASLTGNENVYDLYTGTGTIALFLARFCKKVTGIEHIPEAIEDAKKNAGLNAINNVDFVAGDIRDVLTEDFVRQYEKPDVMIIDPPRAGMHAGVVKRINEILPRRIVYVSCNPATQARDIQLLSEHYAVIQVQPVDMFPHTHHVENVVLLEL